MELKYWDKKEDYLTYAKYNSVEWAETYLEEAKEQIEEILVKMQEIKSLISLAEKDPELREHLSKELQALYNLNISLEEYYIKLEEHKAYLAKITSEMKTL